MLAIQSVHFIAEIRRQRGDYAGTVKLNVHEDGCVHVQSDRLPGMHTHTHTPLTQIMTSSTFAHLCLPRTWDSMFSPMFIVFECVCVCTRSVITNMRRCYKTLSMHRRSYQYLLIPVLPSPPGVIVSVRTHTLLTSVLATQPSLSPSDSMSA